MSSEIRLERWQAQIARNADKPKHYHKYESFAYSLLCWLLEKMPIHCINAYSCFRRCSVVFALSRFAVESPRSVKTHALLLDRVRLPNWQRRAIYGVTAALVLTGLVWRALDLNRGEYGAGLTQVWTLRLHGMAAMVGLVFFGSLLSSHIRIAWAVNRNRVLGATVGGVAITLALTGYGLYYLGGERSRSVASWLHLIFGIGMPFLLWQHIVRGRRLRS